MTAPPGPRGNRLLLIRVVLLLLPFVALAGLELAARTYYRVRHGIPGHRYGLAKYDPVMGYFPRENSYTGNVQLNDHAFRNIEDVFEPKPPGSLRLIAYGGSTTFCHDLGNDEAWPIRLQALMRAHRPGGQRDQVLNGGVVSWSLAHSFERARRDVPRLRPDAVIIYTGVNEMTNANYLEGEGMPMEDLVARGEYGRFATRLSLSTPFRDVITYKFARDWLYPRLVGAFRRPEQAALGTGEMPAAVMTNYVETLRRFVGFLEAHGVQAVVVREVYDTASPRAARNRAITAFSRRGAELAQAWGAVAVDPEPAFRDAASRGAPLFQPSGVHVTAAGADVMARVLFEHAVPVIGADK